MTLHAHIWQLSNTIYNIQSKNSYYSKPLLMYSHCYAQCVCLNLNHESRNYSLVVSKIKNYCIHHVMATFHHSAYFLL